MWHKMPWQLYFSGTDDVAQNVGHCILRGLMTWHEMSWLLYNMWPYLMTTIYRATFDDMDAFFFLLTLFFIVFLMQLKRWNLNPVAPEDYSSSAGYEPLPFLGLGLQPTWVGWSCDSIL